MSDKGWKGRRRNEDERTIGRMKRSDGAISFSNGAANNNERTIQRNDVEDGEGEGKGDHRVACQWEEQIDKGSGRRIERRAGGVDGSVGPFCPLSLATGGLL